MKAYLELRRSAHSVGQNCFHLVWKPKYAYPILVGDVKSECECVLRETSKRYDYGVISLEVRPEHVHCFVSFSPDVPVSKVLNILKGVSSRYLRDKFPHLQRTYYGGHMWSPGKFYRSVGSTTDRAVKHYIECSQGSWKTIKHEIEELDLAQAQITDYT